MTLVEVLKEARITYAEEGQHHHARSGWVQLRDCPWCGSQSFHLGINLNSRACACWRCGVKSSYATLLKLGVPPQLVKQALAGRAFVRVPTDAIAKKLKEPAHRGELLPAHRRYLKSRDLDPDHIASLWDVQGIGPAARLPWRIYIPVIQNRETLSWTARAIGDVSQRYLSASPERDGGANIKTLLYGIDNCHLSVVIVEGPGDVWAIGPGAVALFGTAFTPQQVEQLVSIPYRYVCFDSEPGAQRKAEELAGVLSLFPGTTCNIQLDANDPGSASPKELALLRKEAQL